MSEGREELNQETIRALEIRRELGAGPRRPPAIYPDLAQTFDPHHLGMAARRRKVRDALAELSPLYDRLSALLARPVSAEDRLQAAAVIEEINALMRVLA